MNKTYSERELKLLQALSTARWWLVEASKNVTCRATRAQLTLAAGDARKVIDAALAGEHLPDWLSPLFDGSKAPGER